MKRSRLFEPRARADLDRLIAQYPFALVVATADDAMTATPLPLLLERQADGEAVLIGHFARANLQVALLRRQPRALVVFMGAHGYISPSWLADRTQAPTWNYETVHCEVVVEFDDRGEATHAALERLVEHMELDRPQAWSAAEMGPRYAQLAGAVIAFRARVLATHAKFKLGQNERADVRADILDGLARTDQAALLAAMNCANPPMAETNTSPPTRHAHEPLSARHQLTGDSK